MHARPVQKSRIGDHMASSRSRRTRGRAKLFCLGASIYDVCSGWREGVPKSRRKEQNHLISVCDKGGRGKKIRKFCERHIWKPLSFWHLLALIIEEHGRSRSLLIAYFRRSHWPAEYDSTARKEPYRNPSVQKVELHM